MIVNELIDIHTGERKYLNRNERIAFKDAAILIYFVQRSIPSS